MKKSFKAITSLFVVFTFIFCSTFIVTADKVGPSQEQGDEYFNMLAYTLYAQTFIAERPLLTRVYLKLQNYASNADIEIEIKKDPYSDETVETAVVDAETIPKDSQWHWVEFDFTDVSVTVGNVYYIVIWHHSFGDMDIVQLQYSDSNPYTDGAAFSSPNIPRNWVPYPSVDLCFKVYSGQGKTKDVTSEQDKLEIPIQKSYTLIKLRFLPLIEKILDQIRDIIKTPID